MIFKIDENSINIPYGYCYWSNSCGDLHRWSEYDINDERELPFPLKEPYRSVFKEGEYGPFLCYLVEWKGEYGFALEYECDPECPTDHADEIANAFERARPNLPIIILPGDKITWGGEIAQFTNVAIVFPCDVTEDELRAFGSEVSL